eukprot:11215100-Lingulodinium_polyedra.AAC.1
MPSQVSQYFLWRFCGATIVSVAEVGLLRGAVALRARTRAAWARIATRACTWAIFGHGLGP